MGKHGVCVGVIEGGEMSDADRKEVQNIAYEIVILLAKLCKIVNNVRTTK